MFALGAGGLGKHLFEDRLIKVSLLFVIVFVGFVRGRSSMSEKVLTVEILVFAHFIIDSVFHSFIANQ